MFCNKNTINNKRKNGVLTKKNGSDVVRCLIQGEINRRQTKKRLKGRSQEVERKRFTSPIG